MDYYSFYWYLADDRTETNIHWTSKDIPEMGLQYEKGFWVRTLFVKLPRFAN